MSEKEKDKAGIPKKDISDEIDFIYLAGEVFDKKWLITSITTSFLIIGIIYCLFATPIYRADAMIQIEQNVGNSLLSNINQILPDSQPESAPEIQLIQSRMVLGKTIEDLKLDIDVKQHYFPVFGAGLARLKKETPSSINVTDFSISDDWSTKDQAFTITVKDNTHYTLSNDDDIILQGTTGKVISEKGITILVDSIQAQPGVKFDIAKQTFWRTFNQLQQNLTVADMGKDSGVLGLTFTDDDPVMAKNILNHITENYLAQNIERKSAEDEKSLQFLKVQLPTVRTALDSAEENLNRYRQQKDSVDLSLEAKSVLDTIVAVDSQLNELTFKEAEISKLFTKEHPSYRALLEKRKTLENERDRLNAKVNAMPQTQQEILRLSRDVKSGQEIFMQLLNKEQELSISKASIIGNVRIVDSALTQDKPISPKKLLILLASIFLGLIVSIGYILLKVITHRGIDSPEQLEELGISVYASIPVSEWQRKKDLEFVAKNKHKKVNARANVLLALGNPADPAIEALRSLRTSLHFAMMEAKNNVLMISGASPDIGKTFISANLAFVIAQAGLKVLFIDSDMRKGYSHELFDMEGKKGLSDVLSGQYAINEVVKETINENMQIITRGSIPPNPSELLMHPRFSEVINWASKNYDLVLIDTPPILIVTDAAIIGKQVGTSLIVARFGLNSPKEVEVCIRRFTQNGIDIKGVILNAVIRKTSNYYNYGYDYYDYTYASNKE